MELLNLAEPEVAEDSYEVTLRQVGENSRRECGSAAGFTLLEGIMAAGLGCAVIWGAGRMVQTGFDGMNSIQSRQDLESIKQSINTELDCRQSLGITFHGSPAVETSLPLTCANFSSVTLLTSAGTALGTALPNGGNKIGKWTVKATCLSQHLVVTASAPGNDQLTGLPLNSTPSNTNGATVSTDLFGGTTDFCREYFAGITPTCSASTIQYGTNNSGQPLCCRWVDSMTFFGDWKVDPSVSCNSNEFGINPIANCENGFANPTIPTPAVMSFLNSFWYGVALNPSIFAWSISCYKWDGSAKARGQAIIMCCPK